MGGRRALRPAPPTRAPASRVGDPAPVRSLRSALKSDIRSERHTADDRVLDSQMVEERNDAVCVRVHPVHRRVSGFVRHAVTRKVEKHDPVAGLGQRVRKRSVQVAVEQQPVEVDENLRSRAVHLV